MTARQYDLRLDQGADYHLSIPVVNAAGNPYTVTGWTARGQLRRPVASDDVLFTLDDHLTVEDTTVELDIPAESSAEWSWRQARYDIELVDPDGRPTRLIEGFAFVSPEVTR